MPNYVEYEIPDLIEIRDRQENVKSAIIKRWKVHVMTKEEIDAANQQKEQEVQEAAQLDEELARADKEAEELRLAQEIFERLEREAAEDRAKELEEQRLAYAIANGELPSEMYNPTTHSYSGAYGKKPMDESTKAQLDEIMKESANDVSALFAETGGEPEAAEEIEASADDLAAQAEQALFEDQESEEADGTADDLGE